MSDRHLMEGLQEDGRTFEYSFVTLGPFINMLNAGSIVYYHQLPGFDPQSVKFMFERLGDISPYRREFHAGWPFHLLRLLEFNALLVRAMLRTLRIKGTIPSESLRGQMERDVNLPLLEGFLPEYVNREILAQVFDEKMDESDRTWLAEEMSIVGQGYEESAHELYKAVLAVFHATMGPYFAIDITRTENFEMPEPTSESFTSVLRTAAARTLATTSGRLNDKTSAHMEDTLLSYACRWARGRCRDKERYMVWTS